MQMINLKNLNAESTSIAGFYFGIIGAVIGLIGLLLSAYSLSSGEKAIWLGLSGWLAALALGWALTKLCLRLINVHTELANNLANISQKNATLESRVRELEDTNLKLVEIDSYILTSATNLTAKKRRTRATIDSPLPSRSNRQTIEDPEEVQE